MTLIFIYICRGVPKTIEAAKPESPGRRPPGETDDLVDALRPTGP